MLTDIQLKRQRLDAINAFDRARTNASWVSAWLKLTRSDARLLPLGAVEGYLPHQLPYHRGIQEIPLANIVGSVGRSQEFNRAFYPLRDSLRERWVNMLMLSHTLGWPPIKVFKVGNLYFVEDGHHRVSVARWLKNSVIEAEVLEYPLDRIFEPTASLDSVIDQLRQQQPQPAATMLCSQAACG